MQIGSPFLEPLRNESPGEAVERLAGLAVMAVRFVFDTEPSEKEVEAIKTIIAMWLRWKRTHSPKGRENGEHPPKETT
jgi:hypothetical protein